MLNVVRQQKAYLVFLQRPRSCEIPAVIGPLRGRRSNCGSYREEQRRVLSESATPHSRELPAFNRGAWGVSIPKNVYKKAGKSGACAVSDYFLPNHFEAHQSIVPAPDRKNSAMEMLVTAIVCPHRLFPK